MSIRYLDQVVAALLAGLGAYIVWTGGQYGFMQGTTPGPGFFPALVGGVLIVLSLVNLGRSLGGIEIIKETMTTRDTAKFAGIVAAMLVFVALTPWLGMTAALMLLMLAIGFVIQPSLDRGFLARLVLTSVVTPVLCKLLFQNVMRVPVPDGVLGF